MESFLAGLAGIAVGAFLGLLVQRRLQKNAQAERLAATRREVYGEFLDAAHELFLAIRAQPDAVDALSPHRGQIALERLRLVATLPTEAAATEVWNRLRRGSSRREAGADWVAAYWIAEKQLLTLARADMGLPPLRDGDRD